MAFNVTNPVSVGDATKKDHYDRVFDNVIAVKERRGELALGGSDSDAVSDTGFVDLPAGVHVEIDGTNLGGFTVEVHFMGRVLAGTGTIRLWNITAAAEVSSSQKTFTNTSADRIVSSSLSLASGVNEYKLQVKGSAAADLPQVWGAKLILR